MSCTTLHGRKPLVHLRRYIRVLSSGFISVGSEFVNSIQSFHFVVQYHVASYSTAPAKWQATAPPSHHACAIPGLRTRGWRKALCAGQSTDRANPCFAPNIYKDLCSQWTGLYTIKQSASNETITHIPHFSPI